VNADTRTARRVHSIAAIQSHSRAVRASRHWRTAAPSAVASGMFTRTPPPQQTHPGKWRSCGSACKLPAGCAEYTCCSSTTRSRGLSLHVDGRWLLQPWGALGAIDLCMAVRNVGFQEAARALRALDTASPPSPAPRKPPTSTENVEPSATSENPPFKRPTTSKGRVPVMTASSGPYLESARPLLSRFAMTWWPIIGSSTASPDPGGLRTANQPIPE